MQPATKFSSGWQIKLNNTNSLKLKSHLKPHIYKARARAIWRAQHATFW